MLPRSYRIRRSCTLTSPRTIVTFTAAGAKQASVQGPPSPPALQTTDGPPPNGAISGVVVNGSTGEPVVGAVVHLASVPARSLIRQTRQITDDKGRFAFVNLQGGVDYTVAASKFGYLAGGYGRDTMPTDPLRPIPLRGDAWVPNIRVAVWKPGSISGVIRDEAGEPVVGVFVRVLQRVRIFGRDEVAAGPLTVTDDRGAYRIPDLAPGTYLVQVPSVQAAIPTSVALPATPAASFDGAVEVDDTHRLVISRYPLPPPPIGGRQMAYPSVFHPSTSIVADATTVELTYGGDRDSIDVTLRPVASVRVSGIVDGPVDVVSGLTLRLLPAGLENVGLGSEAATTLVGADRTFAFVNVPSGSYTIDAMSSVTELLTSAPSFLDRSRPRFPVPPPARGSGMSSETIDLIPGLTLARTTYGGGSRTAPHSGRAAVTVGGADLTGVVVRMQPHARMSGRVVVDRDASVPSSNPPARFALRLDAATGEAHLGRPQTSGLGGLPPDQFAFDDIAPGRYFVRTATYPGWTIKSVSVKGRDVTHVPIDAAAGEDLTGAVVTMTNAAPRLSGAVRNTDEIKADAALVIVFPTAPAEWRHTGFYPARLRHATVASNGTFMVDRLPAGDYFVAAISRTHISTWRDPAFLEKVATTASRITLQWGGQTSRDLTPVVVR